MPLLQTCYGGVKMGLDSPCPINVRRLDLGALPMIEAYHRHGIQLDTDHLKTLTSVLMSEEESIRSKIRQSVGKDINWNSGDQVSHLLYKELGLKSPVKMRFTDSGRESADEEALSALKDQHEVVGFILEGRGATKLRTTYAEKLPLMIHPETGRLHTTFKYTRAETGRLTSEDPNLQNIPTRTELGNEVRNGFVAGKDKLGRQCVLASLDLSQIEMVLAGDLSQDPLMCGAFRDGVDIHTLTALKAFNLPADAVNWPTFKKEYRLPAKCFHPDTEVLTRGGWKRIPDLADGEEVIQATPGKAGEVTLGWVKPLEVFTQHHPSGKLVHLHNKGMDLRVTPDHRMLGWTAAGTPRVVEAGKFATAPLRHWANAGLLSGGKRKVDEALLRLAVATQADGSVTVDGGIKFGFSKDRKTTRLRKLLEDAGVRATFTPHKVWMINPMDSFYIRKADAKPILKLLDSDKTMPWSWVSLTTELRQVVLDEVRQWDSCEVDRRAVYSTVWRKNADVLQAICAVTGVKTRLMMASNGGHKPVHALSMRRGHLTRTENLQSDTTEYTEEVACISVPSTFILVRDRGVTTICGQTIGFGILYGQSGQGAQVNILSNGGPFWTVAQCDDLIARWFRVYAGITAWMEDQYSRARRYGMVWDTFGRLRRIPEARSRISRVSRGGLRKAGNMPIQSSAQGMIKLDMAELMPVVSYFQSFPDVRCWPLLQIHDELIFELSPNISDEFCGWAEELMTTNVQLSVPVRASSATAYRWGDLKD